MTQVKKQHKFRNAKSLLYAKCLSQQYTHTVAALSSWIMASPSVNCLIISHWDDLIIANSNKTGANNRAGTDYTSVLCCLVFNLKMT